MMFEVEIALLPRRLHKPLLATIEADRIQITAISNFSSQHSQIFLFTGIPRRFDLIKKDR